MSSLQKKINKIALCLIASMVLVSCKSSEQKSVEHLEKGKELFEKGEYDKAILELKTSAQDSDKRGETYYYMALLDEKSNNFKAMKQNLLKVIELDSNNMQARKKLGKVHLLFGELDRALEQANLLLANDANDQESQLLMASILLRQAKQDDAQKIIDTVLTQNPENIDALSLKSAIYFEKNDFDKALSTVEQALTHDNKNLPLWLFKIKVHAKQNKIDAVINDYQTLIELYPDYQNLKLSLASIFAMTDKLDQAEMLLREMVNKNQDKLEPKVILLEFLQAKRKDKVIAEFDTLLSASQAQPSNMFELSKWMLASGYADQASSAMQRIIELEKDSNIGLSAKSVLAEMALNKNQLDEAENRINEILKANSDFADASLLKARLLLTRHQVDEAIELLNKVIWSQKDSDNGYWLLGQAYTLKKDKKQADKNFKQALDINPANIGAFTPIYTSYLQANQKENARQLLEKALAKKPNNLLLLTSKADLDIAEKKWDDAQETVQKIALFSKNKAVPIYLQANILQGKGQYEAAIKLYESLLQEYPDHLNSMVNLARSYQAIKQHDKAVNFLDSLHKKHPEELTVIGVLGDLYIANNDLMKAKELFYRQIQKYPDKTLALYFPLAKVESMIRKSPEGAKEVYLKGLEANPDNLQLSMALAGLYEQTGNRAAAKTVYEKIIDKHPDFKLAINNLAALLIDSNTEQDVIKGFALAEKIKDSENPYLLDTYAWGLVKTGKVSEGLKILETLIVNEPKMPEIRYHLGMAHFENGNKATAIIELKQALSLADKQKRDFSGKENAMKVLKSLDTLPTQK